MSVNARKLTLDGTGHGTLNIPPAFYAGAKGGGVVGVWADGIALGTTFLTRGTMPAVDGIVTVSGDAAGEVFLYFDFD
jgi:hypothetical protein